MSKEDVEGKAVCFPPTIYIQVWHVFSKPCQNLHLLYILFCFRIIAINFAWLLNYLIYIVNQIYFVSESFTKFLNVLILIQCTIIHLNYFPISYVKDRPIWRLISLSYHVICSFLRRLFILSINHLLIDSVTTKLCQFALSIAFHTHHFAPGKLVRGFIHLVIYCIILWCAIYFIIY